MSFTTPLLLILGIGLFVLGAIFGAPLGVAIWRWAVKAAATDAAKLRADAQDFETRVTSIYARLHAQSSSVGAQALAIVQAAKAAAVAAPPPPVIPPVIPPLPAPPLPVAVTAPVPLAPPDPLYGSNALPPPAVVVPDLAPAVVAAP